MHFFDGFRTSHEIAKIALLPDEVLRAVIDEERVREHRAQAREPVNPFYAACPRIVQRTMDRFADLTGRAYRLFEYHGAPDAERVIVLMGSGCEAAHETVDFLGGKIGVLKVRRCRALNVVEGIRRRAGAEHSLHRGGGGRVADARATVDVVRPEDDAREFLRDVIFLIRRARRAEHADAVRPVRGDDFAQPRGNVRGHFFPRHCAPRAAVANHRLGDAIREMRELEGVAAFRAKVAFVHGRIERGRHLHDALSRAFQLSMVKVCALPCRWL